MASTFEMLNWKNNLKHRFKVKECNKGGGGGGGKQMWAAYKGLLVKNIAQAAFGNDLADVPQWFPMMQLSLD